MAGIYIHIPYCKQACHYCNFHFSTSLKTKNDFVSSLLKEIVLQKEYLQQEAIETIYLGGGTPSLLQKEELPLIFDKLFDTFNVIDGAEITLEANPDDIDDATIIGWREAGINRLSIGVQSFFENDLTWMNRAHNAEQAIKSIKIAQEHSIDNISIDLIYGNPTLPDDHWQKNVERAIALQIPHLSCYALTVEPNTALSKMISQQKVENVHSSDQARQFVLLMQWMEMAGYDHYEISNFAMPGKRSRHNSSYWQGKKYLGLGPSAHSYNGSSRQWNVANNNLYIQSLAKNELIFEKEILTDTQQMNEYIMTSLRTTEGIDLNHVSTKFNDAARKTIETKSKKYITDMKLKKELSRIVLTKEGKLFADGIAADLFF
ncbi:MAG: radical SAM family heme chaperone HemW [Bacteroidetes bacterium]|nr:radical SAM family heme chaperone HemW [Bacteroidota bacterium]